MEPPAAALSVPDVAGLVRGWRMWRGEPGGLLASLRAQRAVWPPGRPLAASCGRGREHEAPDRTCECGIYALRPGAELSRVNPWRYVAHPGLWSRSWFAFGEVALWGRVIEHADGWRAQFAYPLRVFVPGGRRAWAYTGLPVHELDSGVAPLGGLEATDSVSQLVGLLERAAAGRAG